MFKKLQNRIQEDSTTSFKDSCQNYFKGYFDYSGRTGIKSIAIYFVIMIIFLALALYYYGQYLFSLQAYMNAIPGFTVAIVWTAFFLYFIGFVTASCRRLHEVGFTINGAWILWFFFLVAPVVMSVALIVLIFLPKNKLVTTSDTNWKKFIFRSTEQEG